MRIETGIWHSKDLVAKFLFSSRLLIQSQNYEENRSNNMMKCRDNEDYHKFGTPFVV